MVNDGETPFSADKNSSGVFVERCVLEFAISLMKCLRQPNLNLIVIWLLFPFFLFCVRFLLVVVEYSNASADIIHIALNELHDQGRDNETGDGRFEGQRKAIIRLSFICFCCLVFPKPLVILTFLTKERVVKKKHCIANTLLRKLTFSLYRQCKIKIKTTSKNGGHRNNWHAKPRSE